MRTRVLLTVIVSLLLATSWTGAEEISGLPLHVQEIEEGVIRLWVGDHISSTAIMAFATERGIVVVDTFGVPQIDRDLRQAIGRKFGRSDFSYLINTHEHRDHTAGNSIYSDCIIVGHELVEAGMASAAGNRDRLLEWFPTRIDELEAELEALPANDTKTAAKKEDLILNRLILQMVEADERPPAPSLTFSDRLALDLGDTTFELFYIGGMHTASDIAIFVPEHGLLLTGDTMADVWLTDTPGCLASFRARPGIQHDFPRWLHNWDLLLAQRDRITNLLPAHWNGELSIEGAEARVEYVRTLWDGIRRAAENAKTLDEVRTEFQLETRFPKLVGSPGFTPQTNNVSITEIWKEVSGQASAAQTLFTLISEGADEQTVRNIVDKRANRSSEYFYVETEFNQYGYAFLQGDQVEEAITMLEINAELFPDSWNVYDSLGEALLRAGNTGDATAMYEKSLKLNPENTNGKEALKNIREKSSPM